jgi:hypothetical protein
MTKRYVVDFYDMFDGWCHMSDRESDSLNEAKQICDNLMERLDEQNKRAGEHYGVIDMKTGVEVYCTRKNEW